MYFWYVISVLLLVVVIRLLNMHEVNIKAVMMLNFIISKKDTREFDEAFYEYRYVSTGIYMNIFKWKFTVKGFYPTLYEVFQKEINEYVKGGSFK